MNKTTIGKVLKKNEAVSALLALGLFVMLAFTSPYFFTELNVNSLQTSIAPYSIMAVGMMALLISGVFDMSVGSVMCLGIFTGKFGNISSHFSLYFCSHFTGYL